MGGKMSHASLQAASPGCCKAYSDSWSLGCTVGTREIPVPVINGHPGSASLPDLDVGGISEVLSCCLLSCLAPPHPMLRSGRGRRGDGQQDGQAGSVPPASDAFSADLNVVLKGD